MMKSASELRLSGARILVITGEDLFDQFQENTLIQRVWRGTVDYVPGATRERLLEAVRAGYPIVHFLANFGADHISLKDGPISVVQFRELLKLANGRTRLLVLAGCSSYAIGKEIEETGIACSVVATADMEVRLAEEFFLSIYTYLDRGSTPDESFSQAYREAVFRFGPEGRVPLYFTNYGERAREVARIRSEAPQRRMHGAATPSDMAGPPAREPMQTAAKSSRLCDLPKPPWHEPPMIMLRDILVDAYDNVATARHLALCAGVNLHRWNDRQAIQAAWNGLLEVVMSQGKLLKLLDAILSDVHVQAYHEQLRCFRNLSTEELR